jgi:hypothetical protein
MGKLGKPSILNPKLFNVTRVIRGFCEKESNSVKFNAKLFSADLNC